MKISEVLPLIDDIEHLGATSKESISKALMHISENLINYDLIDDIADIYLNIDIVNDKILEEYQDSELYMNIIFDIPNVSTYISKKVIMEEEIEQNKILASMANEVSKVRKFTYLNLFITGVNILIFYMT